MYTLNDGSQRASSGSKGLMTMRTVIEDTPQNKTQYAAAIQFIYSAASKIH